MEFRVLGPLEVIGDEGPIRLGGLKPRAVLAHLLLRANRVVPAAVLIDELWGEELPEDARNALQTHVSRLRTALGDGRVESRSSGYVLLIGPDELDATRFEALLADARADLAEDPAAAARVLQEALALWRGPALSDLAEEPSLAGEVARLEELRLSAVEDRVSAELALGHHARVVGELEAVAREHPLRERVWGDLMLALYRSGRQADALDAYARARAILAEQLGIDPSRRLQRLHEQVLAQDPALSVASRPMPVVRSAAVPGELAPDTTIAGYRIEDLLGRGGMSTVYLAEDLRLRRRIALKILSPELAHHPGFRERFVRESQIVAGIEHPGIVPIYEAGEAEGVLYIAMRYVRGTDLGRLLAEHGPLDPDRAVRIVGRVAEALDAAHEEGLVHRDVKPGNILIVEGAGSRGRDLVYLSDFGLTKRLEDESGALTKTGQFVGTVDYVAPEQIEGGSIDARTDVYSLGCVLFECLTGSPPHARETEVATLYAHLSDEVPRLEDRRPDLPSALGAALAKALAKRPTERFAECGELASAASEALEPQEAGALPAPRWRPLAIAGGAATVLAIAVAAFALRDSGSPASPRGADSPSPSASSTPAPYFTTLDRAPTGDEQRLLALVPEAIRASCEPAEPRAPRIDTDDGVLGAMACDDGVTESLYELFESRGAMDVAFGNRVNDADTHGGNCASDHEAQNDYTVDGEDRGRVMCYRDADRSVIAWTDENLAVLGHAVRGDLGDLSLYEWWLSAGPVEAGAAAEKDGGATLVRFPQGTYLTEITDPEELRIVGVSGRLSATLGIWLSDGDYRATDSGPAYAYEEGTYVVTKGSEVVFSADVQRGIGTCADASAAYSWHQGGDRSIRWTFERGEGGCGPGPYPALIERWVPGPTGEVVFEQYGEILTQDLGVFTADKLTSTPLIQNIHPTWAPDGSRILFSSNRPDPGSTFDLYVMNPDGSGVQALTSDPGSELDPAWSPDGGSIAFVSRIEPTVENSSESSLKILAFPAAGSTAVALVSREVSAIGHPAWSPDGTRLAFSIDTAIYVVDADGSNLTKVVPDQEVADTAPVWTPDGSRIVFWGDDGRDGKTLLTVRPDGSGLRHLYPAVPDAGFLTPSWSADGRWLALSGSSNQVTPLYVVSVDGGSIYTLGLNAADAQWRPEP